MVVMDASAAIELVLHSEDGERVAEAISDPAISLHAPHVIDLEVIQALRRFVVRGEMGAERAGLALENFANLRLRRYSHQPMIHRIWSLRHNITAYDAAYVALCEALGCNLLTFDQRLAKAPGLPVECLVP